MMKDRNESFTFEHFCLDWPWRDPRNAASLAVELTQWAVPDSQWTTDPDSPEAKAWNRAHDAEVPAGPYRTPPTDARYNVDSVAVTEARFQISYTLSYIALYIQDKPIVPPASFGSPDEHDLTRLYWYATELSKNVLTRTQAAYNELLETAKQRVVDEQRPTNKVIAGLRRTIAPYREDAARAEAWRIAGRCASETTEFLRKIASSNRAFGEAGGVAGAILHRIGIELSRTSRSMEEITSRMFHWRVRDAARGRELDPQLEANLQPAFQAAWGSGEYKFAYEMLNDLDALTAPLP